MEIEKSFVRRCGLCLLVMAVTLALVAACAPAAPPAPAPTVAPAAPAAAAPAAAPVAEKPAPAPTPVPPAPTATKKPEVSAADFYKNNPVTWIVQGGAGGGTAFIAQTLAPFWTEMTGGQMIVRPQSGIDAGNKIYEAKADGLTLGLVVFSDFGNPYVFKEPGVRYDLAKMPWIGGIDTQARGLSVAASSPYKSLNDVLNSKGLLFGATVPSGASALGGVLAIELFQLQGAGVVTGYGGGDEIQLALGRSEIGAFATGVAGIQSAVDKGVLRPPVIMLNYKRSEPYLDAPAITEVKQLSPEQRALVDFFMSVTDNARIVTGPPGIPEDRVAFLRDALKKLMEKDTVIEKLKAHYSPWPGFQTGQEREALVKKLAALTKEELAAYNAIIKRNIR